MKKDALEMSKAIRRAIFVYEGARLHALQLNCPIIPKPWARREEEFRLQFIKLVDDLITGKRAFSDPETAHDSWMKKYKEMGWKYGKEYDPDKKTHPDLVPYEELDPREKVKDDVFLALVDIAGEYIW